MFYVYEWYMEKDNLVFYVGKGCRNRYKQTKRNKLFNDVIKNNKCNVRIIKYFEKENDAFEFEKSKILEYKQKNQCLCNLDNGGKGGCHFIWTLEMRKYFSKYNVMKDKNQRYRISINNPMKNEEKAKKVGNKKNRKIFFNNKIYNSIKNAAIENNTSDSNISYWLNRGYDKNHNTIYYLDKPIKNIKIKTHKTNQNKVIYIDKIYDNQKIVANILGINQNTIVKWLDLGFDNKGNILKRILDTNNYEYNPLNYKGNLMSCIYNGRFYNNVKECALDNNISISNVTYFLRKNNENFKYVNQQLSVYNLINYRNINESSTTKR